MCVVASGTWSLPPPPNVFNINMIISISYLGAHSHIRGLGLDDALEPRQVALIVIIYGCGTCFLLSWNLTYKEMYWYITM